MNRLSGETSAAPGAGQVQDFVERMLELGPRLQRALDVKPPEEVVRQLGSVTMHQLEALSCLEPGGTTMRAFANTVGISGAAATALADRMLRQGLAERRDDPSDRRTVWLAPTPKAQRVLDAYRAWQRQAMSVFLERLDPQQTATFLEVLDVLIHLEAEEAPPPP